METLSALTFVVAILAVAGVALLWVYLQRVNQSVNKLKQMHAPAGAGELRRITPPVFDAKEEGQEIVETASTTSAAVSFQNYIIRGVGIEEFAFENQANGDNPISWYFTIRIPEGTATVITSLSGFWLGFGHHKPNDHGSYDFYVRDHHLGMEYVNVETTSVFGTFGRVRVTMLVRDYNGDDQWFGGVRVTLLFLGLHP